MNGLYDLLPGRPDFDESKHRPGRLCKRGHDWMGTGQSLRRINGGSCIECARQRYSTPEAHAYRQEWRKQNLEDQRRKAKERMAKLRQDPEYAEICRERTRSCNAKSRATNGRASRTGLHFPPNLLGHGLQSVDLQAFIAAGWDLSQLGPAMVAESRELWRHLRAFQPSPTVAELVEKQALDVIDQEKAEFLENGGTEEEWQSERQRRKHHAKMATDPDYVLYHRQKSKRRKAQMRESVAIQITGKQIRGRFAEFGHHCAYCGATGDLHIEHVVPISKGGPHAIGNIIPACKDCNFSKTNHDAESWYRQQPSFAEARWQKICRVIGWQRSSVGQLALL